MHEIKYYIDQEGRKRQYPRDARYNETQNTLEEARKDPPIRYQPKHHLTTALKEFFSGYKFRDDLWVKKTK